MKTKPSKAKKPNLRQEVDGRITAYMSGQGYKVTSKASVRGQSGVEHVFDVLAQRDDGFTIRTIALCITEGGEAQAEASAIFDFANKAFDTGIKERVLIAIPKMSLESKKLADKQRIKVFDEEKLQELQETGQN
jgi:general secretion pathway protein E